MSSTNNYYDHIGPDFPELMIIMHIHNLRNVHNMHNMQARAGYARAKGRKLIAGKKFRSSRKDRCVVEAFKYFLQSSAILQCCKFSFLVHSGNKAGMRKILIDVDQYRLI